MKLFIYRMKLIFQLTLKIYNSEEHLVSILSHRVRDQSMKRNTNQRLKRCLEVMFRHMFSMIISNGNS